MSLPCLESPQDTQPSDPKSAILDLIYSGNTLANYLLAGREPFQNCICCGVITSEPRNPSHHTESCPMGSFFRSVETVRKIVLIILIAIVFAGAANAQAQPAATSSKLSRIDWASLGADAGVRGLDVYSTAWNHAHGCREWMLPNAIANHSASLSLFDAGIVAANYIAMRRLRSRHPRLAYLIPTSDAVSTGYFASRNFECSVGVR